MTLKLITAPASEPVTLTEAKAHCRVDGSDDDTLITSLIVTARAECEHELGRALFTQTWERVLDYFPAVEVELGMPPVASITSITYIDTTGTSQTLSASAYVLDADRQPGWVLPAYGYQWPATQDTANAVRIRFVSGWSDTDDIPAPIKHWVLLRVGTLYKFREAIAAGVSATMLGERYADRLLDRYRVHGV